MSARLRILVAGVTAPLLTMYLGTLLAQAGGSGLLLIAVGVLAGPYVDVVAGPHPRGARRDEPRWLGWLGFGLAWLLGIGGALVVEAAVGLPPGLLGADAGQLVWLVGVLVALQSAADAVRAVLGRLPDGSADPRGPLEPFVAVGQVADRRPTAYREDRDGDALIGLLVLASLLLGLAAAIVDDGPLVERLVIGTFCGGTAAMLVALLVRGGLGSSFAVGPSGLVVDDAAPLPWSEITHYAVRGTSVTLTTADGREARLDADAYELSVERLVEVLRAWAPPAPDPVEQGVSPL